MKKKEMEAYNDKMYGKLIHILRNERSIYCKSTEKGPGPPSLNVVARKNSIKKINRENIQISDNLSNMTCVVPSFDYLKKREQRNQKLKSIATSRKPDGSPRSDPLVIKRK